MNFSYNIYTIILLICAFAAVILANSIYKRGGTAVRWFSLLLLSNSIWSAAYGLELASSTISQIIFFVKIEYLGIATLPLNWFCFCLHFCGKECWYKKPLNIFLLLLIPVTTIILVWTNEYHHFQYKNIDLDNSGPFPMANITIGPWYFVFTTFYYILLLSGCYLLLIKFRTIDEIYKRQNYTIIIAATIPFIANISYLLGIRPLGHIDLTPFAFIITSFFILIGIYRFKLFDIIPIAREKVLELMQDGFLVLDQKNRIIDFNRSIFNYIDYDEKQLIGKSLEDLFPNQYEFLNRILNKIAGIIELEVILKQSTLHLEADILFLYDNKINNDFSIIKLQDLTAIKNEVNKTKIQAKELERLNQLKDRIFSIIAHDLRGPLVNISEVLKMITNDQITIEEFKGIAPTLSKDIIYTTDLLENILHWSRSQLKGFGIHKEFFNIRNLIKNEIDYHLPSATLKKIKITQEIFITEVVYADMLMIQIVIRNILNNAIKFCEENCEVKIYGKYFEDNDLRVCIKDNGNGIKASILDKLFNAENISTRGTLNEKGTGLGLLVCKEFMLKNNGQLEVTSDYGNGAKFCLIIPTQNEEVTS